MAIVCDVFFERLVKEYYKQMGYRSHVMFALEPKARTAMLVAGKAVPSVLNEWDNSPEIDDDGTIIYNLEDIKWYEDFSAVQEVIALMNWLDTLTDEEIDSYSFIRLGEEINDIEQRGSYEYFCVHQFIERM